MIQLIRENEERCDAFIIACHCSDFLDKHLKGLPSIQ
jgi:Asp/Glu/hydantoin racemase